MLLRTRKNRASFRSHHISIVSDHPLATHMLKEILQKRAKWHLEIHDLTSYLSAPSVKNPTSTLIIDKGAMNHSFTADLRTIKWTRPALKILVVDKPQSLEEECLLLFLGAHGIVSYDKVRGELNAAVRAIQMGQFWFKSESLQNYSQYLNRRLQTERVGSGAMLTLREREIVDLIKRGLLTKQIATHLGISGSTVKFHVGHILEKLGIRHRREILALKFPETPIPLHPSTCNMAGAAVGSTRLAIVGG
jgi:DNA-binding NarL/FixJ family response regulator